jgi:transcriptional regulator of heat shock response
MDSNTRKKDVLRLIIETFVHTNQPVGSIQVAEQLSYEVSSATVRNDMSEMTELGLLAQPHTSAGRVPTQFGYQHYVKMLAAERKGLSRRQQEVLSKHLKSICDLQAKYRAAAEMLAQATGNVSFLMDATQNVYLSGLSQMARLPEFEDPSFRLRMMEAVEKPVEFMQSLGEVAEGDTQVLIGNNPKIKNATVVISSFGPQGSRRVISIIGPTRMPYNKALPLVDYMRKLLEEL